MPAVRGEFSPPLYLPLTGELHQHRRNEFCARARRKKTQRPREISYQTINLAPLRSSHYPVWKHSDGWELSSSV